MHQFVGHPALEEQPGFIYRKRPPGTERRVCGVEKAEPLHRLAHLVSLFLFILWPLQTPALAFFALTNNPACQQPSRGLCTLCLDKF
jgi:hypothetical protein